MARLAFLDVETTGLNVADARIVEIAIVTTDESGQIIDRYESVLNPLTKMAATKIHGIRATTVAAAPTFPLIAPDVLERLDGSTVVAYNADFDRRFLEDEVRRAGGDLVGEWVCAMAQASRVWGGRRMKLGDLAQEVGVRASGELHCAMTDAELCAGVFFAMGAGRNLPTVAARSPSSRRVPAMPRSGADGHGTARRPVAAQRSLGRTGMAIEALASELTAAFADSQLTLNETKHVALSADQAGLSAGDVLAAYNALLEAEIVEVLRDGVVDADERARLRIISHHIGFPAPYVESRLGGESAPQLGGELQPGMTVVLSNMADELKWDLTMACAEVGIAVRHSVAKTIDLVVVQGPPNTGKARKATEIGIPLMDVQPFEAALQVRLDPTREGDNRSAGSDPAPSPRSAPPPLPTPKGWFVDPLGRNQWRWWNGEVWTDQVGNDGRVATDPPV